VHAFPALCLPTVSPHVAFGILLSGVSRTSSSWPVYTFTAGFPRQETYGLALLMRRLRLRPRQYCEGFRRRGKADKARFMNVAEGSVEECRYFLILASDLGYGDISGLSTRLDEVSKMLNPAPARFWLPRLLAPVFHIPQGYQGEALPECGCSSPAYTGQRSPARPGPTEVGNRQGREQRRRRDGGGHARETALVWPRLASLRCSASADGIRTGDALLTSR
jgi:four helix bundle protein